MKSICKSSTLLKASIFTALFCVFLPGAEPENANDAYISFKNKKRVEHHVPNTICDGLRTVLSKMTFEYGINLESLNNISSVSFKSPQLIRSLITSSIHSFGCMSKGLYFFEKYISA